MFGYSRRLQNEISRRDTALANLAKCGRTSITIVKDTVDDTQHAVRAEIDHTKAFISEQIRATGELVSSTIDHAGDTVGRQVDVIKTSLNPATLIREHPLGTTVGAVLAGIVIVPLVRSLLNNKPATLSSASNGGTQSDVPPESRWKPVTDALLENLPGLIAVFMKRNDAPSRQQQSTVKVKVKKN